MNKKNETPFFIISKVIAWPFKSFLRILLVVAVISLYIYQSVLIDELAGEIRQLEIKKTQLVHEHSNIQTQIDQLTNINRIEKLAKEKFGLINDGNQTDRLVIKRYEPEKKTEIEPELQLAGVK